MDELEFNKWFTINIAKNSSKWADKKQSKNTSSEKCHLTVMFLSSLNQKLRNTMPIKPGGYIPNFTTTG